MSLIADTEQPTFSRRRIRPAWVVLALVALLGLAAVARLVPSPTTVHRLTIRNATQYDLQVDASGGARDGWTPVGIALARSDTEVQDVIDHGDVWIFRFAGQGQDGGEVQVTRAQLEASGWQLTVPASVGDRIRSSGVPPSPTQRG
jgi:hypothetical protein